MKAKTKARILDWTGLGVSIAAPLTATAAQFPVFVENGASTTVSGVFLLVAIVACIPLVIFAKRQVIKNPEKSPPYAFIVSWALVGGIVALQSILPQALIIATAWAGGTTTAKGMTAIGHHLENKEQKAILAKQESANNAILALANAQNEGV